MSCSDFVLLHSIKTIIKHFVHNYLDRKPGELVPSRTIYFALLRVLKPHCSAYSLILVVIPTIFSGSHYVIVTKALVKHSRIDMYGNEKRIFRSFSSFKRTAPATTFILKDGIAISRIFSFLSICLCDFDVVFRCSSCIDRDV